MARNCGAIGQMPASRDGRASLWHAEDENGSDALLDEAPAEGCHRDALHVLAYNLTGVINITGPQPLMAAIRA